MNQPSLDFTVAPPVKRPPSPAPMRASVVRLMQLLRNGADLVEVEAEFRADPVLSYKLLRFMNSAASGFTREVASFRQAITVLGYQQLHRWMVVLLIAADHRPGRSAVVKAALVRGRFLELVGEAKLGDSGSVRDMFMVGVLSCLDEVLGLPLRHVIAPLNLPEVVRLALLEREGFHGSVLELAEALEAADEEAVDDWIAKGGMDVQLLCDCYSAAIDWVDSLPL